MSDSIQPFDALPIPFAQDLGLKIFDAPSDQSSMELDVLTRHTNSWGVAHGGVLMTLLDVAMALACRNTGDPAAAPGSGATLEMKTSFFKPAGGKLSAQGRVIQRGGSIAFCEAEVKSQSGELFAKASGTFKWIRSVPAPVKC